MIRDGVTAGIEVVDTGTGMALELARRAFERFEKGADPVGSGLGLAIVRELVEAQGGRVELHSEPGRGTRVLVRMPALDERR